MFHPATCVCWTVNQLLELPQRWLKSQGIAMLFYSRSRGRKITLRTTVAGGRFVWFLYVRCLSGLATFLYLFPADIRAYWISVNRFVTLACFPPNSYCPHLCDTQGPNSVTSESQACSSQVLALKLQGMRHFSAWQHYTDSHRYCTSNVTGLYAASWQGC